VPRTAVTYLLPQDHLEEDALLDHVAIGHVVVERDTRERPGLAEALEWIARGSADTLIVTRLGAASGSLGELMRLLDWLGRHGASLIALDVELDTGGRSGRRTLAVLREVHRWARQPELPRRPPGRPGLSERTPEVARRISTLREQGLSLHAIAETLNAEKIPTPRGGARWRASSVQAALGYQRPRPPVPRARPGHGRGKAPKPPGDAVKAPGGGRAKGPSLGRAKGPRGPAKPARRNP